MKKYLVVFVSVINLILPGQNVSPFTGAFDYNVPLLNIPSNRGAPVSIDANYRAGIQVKQGASDIGLGWNTNADAAIYRTAMGVPDDCIDHVIPDFRSYVMSYGVGALYPTASSTIATEWDFFKTRRGLDTTEFTFTNFDNYTVQSPGLSGTLKLGYQSFYSADTYSAANTFYKLLGPPIRQPQFHMAADFSSTLTARHYSTAVSGISPFNVPSTTLTGNGYTASAEPFYGYHTNGTVTTQDFNPTTGRIATASYIEYFTNAEIDAANSGSFSASPGATLYALNNFVDCKSVHSRTSSVYPRNGIGAFRIMNQNGLSYHYSLPVYELENTSYMIPLNNDYSMPSAITTTAFSNGDLDVFPGDYTVAIKIRTPNKYAIKWLLTAVTGPDYVDSNGNHEVDDDDAGYWMKYDYELWSSSFAERFPHYGFEYSYQLDEASKYNPLYSGINDLQHKVSGIYGTVNVRKSEVYYLSRIRSSSHTAIFVKDVRSDEKEGDVAITHTSSTKPSPTLKTSRIALFRNSEIDSIVAAYPTSSFSPGSYSQFDFTTTINNTGQFFTENWWVSAPTNWKYCVLKHVEFDQDYSLSKKYHGNVNVDCNNSTVLMNPATIASSISVGTNSLSGKLTLKRILFYEFANTKLAPSIKFDYDQNNQLYPNSNPDYDPRKTDYWGYYKSDISSYGYSNYTTKLSSRYTKAWSLLKITNELGGTTEMEYESNSYSKVLDLESSTGFRGPAFLYRIATASGTGEKIGTTFTVTMEEGFSSPILSELAYLKTDSINTLSKKICIPFTGAITPSVALPATGVSRGFYNGECTYTVISGNKIAGSLTTPSAGCTTSGTVMCPQARMNLNPQFPIRQFVSSGQSFFTVNVPVPGDEIFSATYPGAGFLKLETPSGYTAYGGGIRLRKLKTTSGSDVYIKQYVYEGGVATNEADRFEYPRAKRRCKGSSLRFDFLQEKEYSPLDMETSVGYTKVTIKDLGQINSPNGKIVVNYITDPKSNSGIFDANYQISSFTGSNSSSGQYIVNTINECTNKFQAAFGSLEETKIYDVNDNIISRSANIYTTTNQGANTCLMHFTNVYAEVPSGFSTVLSSSVNIVRDVPVILKSSVEYKMGTMEVEQTLTMDETTGRVTSSRSTAKNESSLQNFSSPAYKYYQNVDGLTFDSLRFRRVLPLSADLFNYSTVDSTLASNTFLRAGYSLYSKTFKQRKLVGNIYTTTTTTLPHYMNNRSFIFDAGQGSMNDYGLFNKSDLASNTMSLAASTSSLYWEATGGYNWKLVNEVTMLDAYKHIVESRDANRKFSACRYGYDGYYKTAEVSNCNYASFTFSGFESAPTNTGVANIDGDLIVNNHSVVANTSIVPHSGLQCIQVTTAAVTFTSEGTQKSPNNTLELGLMPGRIYRAGVWTYTTNSTNAVLGATLTGNITSPSVIPVANNYSATIATNSVTQIGNWTLIQVDITVPENFTCTANQFKFELKSANGSAVYFDDFVLHPVESEFSAAVYNPRNGRLMSALDENGLATNYFYDAMGRVSEIWKEIPSVGYKKVKKHSYNYARGAND